MLVALIAIHLACLVALVVLSRRGALENVEALLVPAALVPLFGPCCAALVLLGDWWHPLVESRTLELVRVPPDETYEPIAGHEATDMDDVVPIEEAMLVNEPSLRRHVMLEVLYAGTGGLVEQLRLAGINSDTEVVHYAVTALVELRKSFDVRQRALDRRWDDEDGREGLVEDYLRFDEEYLASGLLSPDERLARLNHYRTLLDQEGAHGQPPLAQLEARAMTDIELAEYGRAREAATRIVGDHPDSEVGYICLLKLAVAERDTKALAGVLRMLDERNVYLSPENRRSVDFWKEVGA